MILQNRNFRPFTGLDATGFQLQEFSIAAPSIQDVIKYFLLHKCSLDHIISNLGGTCVYIVGASENINASMKLIPEEYNHSELAYQQYLQRVIEVSSFSTKDAWLWSLDALCRGAQIINVVCGNFKKFLWTFLSIP